MPRIHGQTKFIAKLIPGLVWLPGPPPTAFPPSSFPLQCMPSLGFFASPLPSASTVAFPRLSEGSPSGSAGRWIAGGFGGEGAFWPEQLPQGGRDPLQALAFQLPVWHTWFCYGPRSDKDCWKQSSHLFPSGLESPLGSVLLTHLQLSQTGG